MHYIERQHSFSNISIASELGLELATGADVPGSGGANALRSRLSAFTRNRLLL